MKTIKKILHTFIVTPLAFIQKYFKTFVFLFIVILIVSSSSTKQNLNANLAKIYLRGPIFESETFAIQIEALKELPNVKGILLVIDSPGGGLAASVEIADMIKALGEEYPIVAYVQGTMASGSYYAGMYAHTIVANRGSMIGSIGVILNGYNIEELMNKIGVQSQSLAAGAYKEIGTMTRKWSESEKSYLQNVLNQQYDMFVTDVSNARRLNKANYQDFAEGKIFNAYDAKKLGLIDLVGSQVEAVNILQSLSGVKEIKWAEKGLIDSYLEKIVSKSISQIFSHLTNIK